MRAYLRIVLVIAPVIQTLYGVNTFADTMDATMRNGGDKQKFKILMDDIWSWKLKQFPEFATRVGHREGNDKWTDLSDATINRRKRDIGQFARQLAQINRDNLGTAAAIDYAVLSLDLKQRETGNRFPAEYLQISQMEGVHIWVPYTLKTSPRKTLQDYENLLARLDTIPDLIEQVTTLLTTGLSQGITMPRIALRSLPDQIDGLLPSDHRQSPLFEAFRQPSDNLTEKQAADIQQRAESLLTEKVYPAFNALRTFLAQNYLPNARESISMSSLSEGKSWYQHQVAHHTTTELSPAEIHKIGLSEVRRIRKEMNRVVGESGFNGGFAEFIKFINTDKQFFMQSPEDLLTLYRALGKQADAKMPQLFHTLPRLPYGVEAVEKHVEKSVAAAYYYPGSIEAARAGFFYANTYDLNSRPKWLMPALLLHEAVPGHHLQIALAQELDTLHSLRKHQFWTAYVEGWALYAESLGDEIDFYPDAYAKFGRLSMEMMRAIRLVVDTGMHALGWSREQAIDFFKQNSPTPEHDIVVEIDRYIVLPGQALAYKTGELKIRELRNFAEKKLGERFDLREFHHQILGNGAVPLDVLHDNIHNWVKKLSESS